MKRKRPLAADISDAPAVPPNSPGEVPKDLVISPAASKEEPVVAQGLLDGAKRAIETDRLAKPARCSVCGEDCAPNSNEGLCWVCRRLKLSAWRDSDMQMPAQE